MMSVSIDQWHTLWLLHTVILIQKFKFCLIETMLLCSKDCVKIRAYLTSLCYFSVLYRIVILNITLGYLTCNQLKMSLPPRLPCLEKAQKLINSFLLICEEGKVPRCEEIGRKEPLHSLGIQLMLGGVALSLTLLLGRGW